MNKFLKWTHAPEFNCLNTIVLCWFRYTPFVCDYKAKFTVSEFYNIFLHTSGKIIISINAVFFKTTGARQQNVQIWYSKRFSSGRKSLNHDWGQESHAVRILFVSDCIVTGCIVLLFYPINIFPGSRKQNCRHGDFQQVSRNEGIQS